MRPRRFAWFVTLTMLAAVPRISAAQAPAASSAAPAPEAAQRAEALYKEGVRLFREKKWAEAEREFRAAWALNPTFDVAYNLGNVEFRLGKYRDAAEHLAFALRVWPLLEATSALRPIAEKRLAESRAHVGALTVTANVAGADVLVDGQVVGKTPLPGEVFVEPGAHTVEVKLKGYLGDNETVQLEKGAAKSMELRLIAPMPMDASPPKISAASASSTSASTESAKDNGLRKTLIIAGIASSAVAVAGGVAFAIVSTVEASDADEQVDELLKKGGPKPCSNPLLRPECSDIDSMRKARDTFADLSVWTFVAGGVLGAGTAIYALAAPRSRPMSATVRVLPGPLARGGALVVAGEW